MSLDYLYDEINYFISNGLGSASATDEIALYDWNLGVTPPIELVSYWKMDEATGNIIDAYGSYDGTETGTVPSAAGIIDTARGVYSTIDYFKAGDAATFNNNLFIIEAWIKTGSITSSTGETLFATSQAGSGNGWAIYGLNNHKFRWYAAGALLMDTVSVVDDNTYKYFVWARIGNAAGDSRVYINAVQDNSAGNGAAITATSDQLRIGVQQNGGNAAVHSIIDELAYHNLTSSSKTWADWEAIFTERYNSGAGKKYSV